MESPFNVRSVIYRELRVVAVLAMQSVMAEEAAREQVVHPSARALDLLVDTIERLAKARSVEDIAAVVRVSARLLSGAEGVAVVVRDGDRCHYIDEDAIGPLWKGSRFPLTACISGWAMLNNQAAVIPDIYLDPRIPHDAYRPTFVKSLVMTPVGRDEPVAAIGAYWSYERTPEPEEIEALSAVARATATAFENVRLNASLNEAIDRRDFLIRELDHRVKNTLASVQAIAHQTARTAGDKTEFLDAFNPRLMALSRAHALLTRQSWKSAAVEAVVEEALAPFDGIRARIETGGPSVRLGPVQAVAAQLALHELVVNALQHGALSRPEGRAVFRWEVDMAEAERRLVLDWSESGGPQALTPTRRGMGLRLIQEGLPHALGGECWLKFEPEGFTARISAPLSRTVELA